LVLVEYEALAELLAAAVVIRYLVLSHLLAVAVQVIKLLMVQQAVLAVVVVMVVELLPAARHPPLGKEMRAAQAVQVAAMINEAAAAAARVRLDLIQAPQTEKVVMVLPLLIM
jgi:hypothetical protein